MSDRLAFALMEVMFPLVLLIFSISMFPQFMKVTFSPSLKHSASGDSMRTCLPGMMSFSPRSGFFGWQAAFLMAKSESEPEMLTSV